MNDTFLGIGFLIGFLFIVVVCILILIVRKLIWLIRPSRVSVHEAAYAKNYLRQRGMFSTDELGEMSDEAAVAKLRVLNWFERQSKEKKLEFLRNVDV